MAGQMIQILILQTGALLVALSVLCGPLASQVSSTSSQIITTTTNTNTQDSSSNNAKISNVINIKYQNTTTTSTNTQTEYLQEYTNLKIFKLFDEPLSPQIIEAKFSNSIELFDVSNNNLSRLPLDLFCPLSNQVRHLNISSNLLENFDCLGLISQNGQLCLSELRVLDMSHNLIKHLPATGVATLHNLEVLNLSNNLIETLDELSLSSLFKLSKLDLSNNVIHQLPVRIFAKSTSLRILRLQSNRLRMQISQMFLAGLTSLEELNLAHNNITHLNDFALMDKQNLTRVDLRHNKLTGLRQDAIQVTIANQQHSNSATNGQNIIIRNNNNRQHQVRHRLHHNGQFAANQPTPQQLSSQPLELFISHNPLICDCQLEWLKSAVGPASLVADLDQVKCTPLWHRAGPRQQQQQQHLHSSSKSAMAPQPTAIDLIHADPSNFLCRYKSHCFAMCHCCEFDACDCEMICPLGCNCYYDSSWQTNIIDCSSNNHTVVPDRIPMDVSGLYLDGNNIDSVRPSNLIARKSLRTLYLNSSNLNYIANRTFNGLIELQTLHLNDNQLKILHGFEFEPLAQLRALYLSSNRLEHINEKTFIYLRSLEVLDLANNRLTSQNVDLFRSIGHHNIRLRQLSIAHNWWSCKCDSIQKFRQILKQKFLSVNIADKNQLRCYYNATAVGPLLLSESTTSSSSSSVGPSASGNNNARQAGYLTEISQCSETLTDDFSLVDSSQANPPYLGPPPELGGGAGFEQSQTSQPSNDQPAPSGGDYPSAESQPNFAIDQPPNFMPLPSTPPAPPQPFDLSSDIYTGGNPQMPPPQVHLNHRPPTGFMKSSSNMPLTSFIVLCLICAFMLIVAAAIFAFVRQQQHQQSRLHHKSSAASVSSSAVSGSSGVSTAKSQRNATNSHLMQAHHTLLHPQQQQHLIISSNQHPSGYLTSSARAATLGQTSNSSQSNIYAALVSPPPSQQQQLQHNQPGIYSNSSPTSTNQFVQPHSTIRQSTWQQQSLYASNPYAAAATTTESPYYKTNTSLYNAPLPLAEPRKGDDWIVPVKRLVSKLVHKSLAKVEGGLSRLSQAASSTAGLDTGGPRNASYADEYSSGVLGASCDKIYDAFISYDKRDEAFVLQHLSAELEYGQPQYRIADRFRDLPLPSSAYIAEAITSVIGCSYRTIVVLTANYVTSEWCRYELRAAIREASVERSHKIVVVVLDPKCLLDLDPEMRVLLTSSSVQMLNGNGTMSSSTGAASSVANQQPLVQLADQCETTATPNHLVATLTSQVGGNQQVSTQTLALAQARMSFLNYNERKFWPKLKQLMPQARTSAQAHAHALTTLTTKN